MDFDYNYKKYDIHVTCAWGSILNIAAKEIQFSRNFIHLIFIHELKSYKFHFKLSRGRHILCQIFTFKKISIIKPSAV